MRFSQPSIWPSGVPQVALPDPAQHAHLPHRLRARGGVHAHRGLHQFRILQMGDVALPHVEVDQMRAVAELRPVEDIGGRRLVRVVERQVGLREERDRRGALQLRQAHVPAGGGRAVVLHLQAVDVHAAATDGEVAIARGDREAVGGRRRHHGAAGLGGTEGVHRRGLQAARDLRDRFVPVRVELHATLLHQHPGVVLAGIETQAAEVNAHRGFPSVGGTTRGATPARTPGPASISDCGRHERPHRLVLPRFVSRHVA